MLHVKSFAKINLSLDVGDVMPNGMHPVDMIMQQISLHDDVAVSVQNARRDLPAVPDCGRDSGAQAAAAEAIAIANGFSVLIKTNSDEIPVDSGNIAFKAAEKMAEKYAELFPERAAEDDKKTICIFIEKSIPVAAGLAGGSGNAAAVIHALNAIWNLGLSLEELCHIGSTLGSDVPFCIMGQAKENFLLPDEIKRDPLAATCARARGTGTELTPIFPPLRAHIIIATPRIAVSTAEVYKGIDSCEITARPDNDLIEAALMRNSIKSAVPSMINVLENYTLGAYPEVQKLKTFMEENFEGAKHILMSGSGPSVFAIFKDQQAAMEACHILKHTDQLTDIESFLCKTI